MPLGPAMLAAALGRAYGASLRTRILDLFLDDGPGRCSDLILAEGPAWVGFSMYVWNRALTLEVARELRLRAPELVIFAGGPEATADLPGVLREPAMDFVLPGEAEELIVAAVARLRRGDPPRSLRDGLAPGPVRDLAALRSPWLDGILDPAAYSGQLWELSRGCPFTCDFCFEARGAAGTRRVPMARVEAELARFEAARVSQVFVLDPTFNYDRRQAKEILRLIARTAPDIHFFFEIRSEFLDRELAGLFAAVKCTLQIGLQSARPEVLRNIGRTMDPAGFQARILLLHQAGATYGFDLIHGLPGDTLEGWLQSLDFALALVPNHLDLFNLAVLPGTRLLETAPGFGLEFQAESPYRVTASPTFGAADLARAGRIAHACDVFYNQGKAVPWFGLVLGAQELPPSALFERFADFLDAHPGSGPAASQAGFLIELFAGGPRPELGTIAAALATYCGCAAELAEAPDPAARAAAFHHDPEVLLAQMAAGITELEDLSYMVPARPCRAELTRTDGEPRLRILPS